MNKGSQQITSLLLSAALCLGGIQQVAAQSIPAEANCNEKGVLFGFLNGVNTTPDEAEDAKIELAKIYGLTSPKSDPITYELLYNHSNGLEDFVETFDQRLKEQGGLLAGRFELFFSTTKGGGAWWDHITEKIPALAGVLGGLVDVVQAAWAQHLTADLATPDSAKVYREHQEKIHRWILAEKKLLLVAHSQGNLFVNVAYQRALQHTGSASVKVVHIAPASPQTNGEHTLADLDLVINALRLVGSVPGITDFMPGYLLRPPGLNGEKDIKGHGLLEIYLNPALDVSRRVNAHIIAALNALESPPGHPGAPYPEFVEIPFPGGPRPDPIAVFGGQHALTGVFIKNRAPVTYERTENWPYWRRDSIAPYGVAYEHTHGMTVEGLGVAGSLSCLSRQWSSEFEDSRGNRILLQKEDCTYSNLLGVARNGIPRELHNESNQGVGHRVSLLNETWGATLPIAPWDPAPMLTFASGTMHYESFVEQYKDWHGNTQYKLGARQTSSIRRREEPLNSYGLVSTNFHQIQAWERAHALHVESELIRFTEYDQARWRYEFRQRQCAGSTVPPGDGPGIDLPFGSDGQPLPPPI